MRCADVDILVLSVTLRITAEHTFRLEPNDDADGSAQTRLTDNPASDDLQAVGGRLRIYFSMRTGNFDVYVMNADGSGSPVNLTNNQPGRHALVESPDGKNDRVHETRSGHFAIYRMNVEGSSLRKLTQTALRPRPRTGRRMAGYSPSTTTSAGRARKSDIWVMGWNGSGLRKLTANFGNILYPSGSPDGEQIAFTHWADLTFPRPTSTRSRRMEAATRSTSPTARA
jgi:Tol biopolymer transport system component